MSDQEHEQTPQIFVFRVSDGWHGGLLFVEAESARLARGKHPYDDYEYLGTVNEFVQRMREGEEPQDVKEHLSNERTCGWSWWF